MKLMRNKVVYMAGAVALAAGWLNKAILEAIWGLKTIALVAMLIPLVTRPFMPYRKAAQKDLEASVVLHIKALHLDKDGGRERVYYSCSGTYISPTTILTAAHCFQDDGLEMWARGPYENLGYPVHLVYWDKRADLALLDAPFRHSYVKLGGIPDWGDKVLNIGSPFDFEFVQSEGKVGMNDYHAQGFTGDYLVTTAMANPGSSGGGAFDKDGKLIGVNTMIIGIFGWSGLTLTVNTDTIHLFLGQALRNYHHYGGR